MGRLSDADSDLEGRDEVHFDTATLERIIPYVQELRDRVRKVTRDTEDSYASLKGVGIAICPHES